ASEPLRIGITQEGPVVGGNYSVGHSFGSAYILILHISYPNAVLGCFAGNTVVVDGAGAVLDFFTALEKSFFQVAKEKPGCVTYMCTLHKIGYESVRLFLYKMA